MSRSLSRIRSLVSEIEDIQRSGQQSRLPKGEPAAVSSPIPTPPVVEVTSPIASVPAREVNSISEEPDTFAALNDVVQLDESPVVPGRVFMKLSGSVSLNLQIEDSGETVELKQVGNLLEIRFEDGKAFHLPLKAVA